MANTADPTAFAEWADVQKGLEKPIPTGLQPKVDEFLARASVRLRMLRRRLDGALTTAVAEHVPSGPGDDLPLLAKFVRDMVVDAAERKARNPGGFSHENAGVFSVSRYEDFAKGRIDFNPADLVLLDEYIDDAGVGVRGPIRSGVPAWRRP